MTPMNLTGHDFTLADEGSIVVLHPCNDAARSWIDEHIYGTDEETGEPANTEVQWWGGGVVIERRYVGAILAGIGSEGLTVG